VAAAVMAAGAPAATEARDPIVRLARRAVLAARVSTTTAAAVRTTTASVSPRIPAHALQALSLSALRPVGP
jgi:hypothetical protein